MKHLYYIIIGICLLLAGCDTHSSDNGELDGFWQVRTMENLLTGEVADGRDHQITWAFQGDFLMLNFDRNKGGTEYVASFTFAGDALKVYNPYLSGRFSEGNDDAPVVDATELNILGIYNLEESFKVVKLDGSDMCLQSEAMRIYFRRY